MKGLHSVAFVLVIIGGINWGIIGLAGFSEGSIIGGDWNVVHMILSFSPQLEWLVYILVGVSAVLLAVSHKKDCRFCGTQSVA